MVQTRYGSLGISGHSLRNKIPIVGNQGERDAPTVTLMPAAVPGPFALGPSESLLFHFHVPPSLW